MKTHHFIIKEDGNLYVIPEMPDPKAVWTDAFWGPGSYESALERALESAILVENQKLVKAFIIENINVSENRTAGNLFTMSSFEVGELYPLECQIEVKEVPINKCDPCSKLGVWHCAHPEECNQIDIKQVALITFSVPKTTT